MGVLASAAAIAAVLATQSVASHQGEVGKFRAATRCTAASSEDCLEILPAVVSATRRTGSSSSIDLTGPGPNSPRLAIFEDYGGVFQTSPGTAVTLVSWHAQPAAVAIARDRFALTSTSPQSNGSQAYALLIIAVVVALGSATLALSSARAAPPSPPSYTLPYVVRAGPGQILVPVVAILALAALALDPFKWTYVPFSLARSFQPYSVYIALFVVFWPLLFLRRIVVRDDAIDVRDVFGRATVTYGEIERVETGRRRIVLHRASGLRPVAIAPTLFATSGISILLDALRTRAPSAGIDEEAVRLATGRRVRTSGLGASLRVLRWSAPRLSDRLSNLEIAGTACGVLMVLVFGIGAILIARENAVWALVCAAMALALGALTPTSVMQMRHRRHLQARLAERGATALGRVVEKLPLMADGVNALVRYRFESSDGVTHELAAFDAATVADRWRVGDAVTVRYDPTDPDTALLGEPASAGGRAS